MALVVETGLLVPAAVSYVTAAEARAYAAARGITLSASDAIVEPLLVQAMDYLDRYEDDYQGSRVDVTQALPWPREGVYLLGELFASDAIPAALKKAQMQLAIDASNGDLQPTGSGREIVRQKVDVIETEYAKTGSGSVTREFNKAFDILKPLLKTGALAANLTIQRT